MPFELILCLVALIYFLGSFLALRSLDDLFKLQRWVNKNLQIDYFIKGRTKLVIVAGLFSWISYFALEKLKKDMADTLRAMPNNKGTEDVSECRNK